MRTLDWMAVALACVLGGAPQAALGQADERPRARDAGVVVGTLPTGPLNAIVDVRGDKVKLGIEAGVIIGLVVLIYVAIPLMTLHWYAKYFRHAAAATSLGELEFEFDATTLQWLGLFLGNLALAIVTLGFGLTYWGYRNWAFMVRHMRIYGTIDIADLVQSTTHAPVEAEGFADAFDVGAI